MSVAQRMSATASENCGESALPRSLGPDDVDGVSPLVIIAGDARTSTRPESAHIASNPAKGVATGRLHVHSQ